ncbi:sushi domain-containing protein 3 isoform X3 [Erpetoichthys calabaricus]|uniref:Zgc:162331 n=1 Tax=Erpetoichthys calabaricus TaxID=27687 RepID=A0A8C4X7T4_ERPCA|nr:sushi domain-containing protein 3 isoform X3 [Erpetoichthys calabaricus]
MTPEDTLNSTEVTTHASALQCELHTSQCGSFFIEEGSGTSVGTILVFWCKEGYQLVGSEKVTCELRKGAPVWNNHFPVCEAIPQPEDKGFQLAVLASIISCIIILTLSASFIVCCIRQKRLHLLENKRDVSDSRSHENLQKSSRQEIFSERQEYSNVVLQRILIPNAAPSLHLPPQSIDIHVQMVTTHPNILFSSPMETPRRHCLLLQPV